MIPLAKDLAESIGSSSRRARSLCVELLDRLQAERSERGAVDAIDEAIELPRILALSLDAILAAARSGNGVIALSKGRGRVSKGEMPPDADLGKGGRHFVMALQSGGEDLGFIAAEGKPVRAAVLKRIADAVRRALLLAEAQRSLPPAPIRSIVGHSPALRRALQMVEQAAPLDTPILFHGERGTGKSLLARAMHDLGPRRDRPFVRIDLAALPAAMIEAGLARSLEQAKSGTILIQNIDRLGRARIARTSARLAFTTREQPGERATVVAVPAIRERREDLPCLIDHFLSRASEGRNLSGFDRPALEALLSYSYPGNVAELEAAIDRAARLAEGPLASLADLPEEFRRSPASLPVAAARNAQELRQAKRDARELVERRFLIDALRRSEGQVSLASRQTGVHRTRLAQLMARFKIRLSDFRPKEKP